MPLLVGLFDDGQRAAASSWAAPARRRSRWRGTPRIELIGPADPPEALRASGPRRRHNGRRTISSPGRLPWTSCASAASSSSSSALRSGSASSPTAPPSSATFEGGTPRSRHPCRGPGRRCVVSRGLPRRGSLHALRHSHASALIAGKHRPGHRLAPARPCQCRDDAADLRAPVRPRRRETRPRRSTRYLRKQGHRLSAGANWVPIGRFGAVSFFHRGSGGPA